MTTTQKILVLSALGLLIPMTVSATEEATEKNRRIGIGLNIDNQLNMN